MRKKEDRVRSFHATQEKYGILSAWDVAMLIGSVRCLVGLAWDDLGPEGSVGREFLLLGFVEGTNEAWLPRGDIRGKG